MAPRADRKTRRKGVYRNAETKRRRRENTNGDTVHPGDADGSTPVTLIRERAFPRALCERHCGLLGSARLAKQQRASACRVTELAPASLRRMLNYGFLIRGKMRDASRSPINSPFARNGRSSPGFSLPHQLQACFNPRSTLQWKCMKQRNSREYPSSELILPAQRLGERTLSMADALKRVRSSTKFRDNASTYDRNFL